MAIGAIDWPMVFLTAVGALVAGGQLWVGYRVLQLERASRRIEAFARLENRPTSLTSHDPVLIVTNLSSAGIFLRSAEVYAFHKRRGGGEPGLLALEEVVAPYAASAEAHIGAGIRKAMNGLGRTNIEIQVKVYFWGGGKLQSVTTGRYETAQREDGLFVNGPLDGT